MNLYHTISINPNIPSSYIFRISTEYLKIIPEEVPKKKKKRSTNLELLLKNENNSSLHNISIRNY